MLIQYLKFGFALSLLNLSELHNTSVKSHQSADQFPTAIKDYLHQETSLGAMLGPENAVTSEHFHCSPLLTHPKDKDKHCVILNLSHPYGCSVNDNVTKDSFDGRKFSLKFPTIDDIINHITSIVGDPVIYKIDVARAFRNIRVDPVDAIKFGIH